jgi:hypothetical protein
MNDVEAEKIDKGASRMMNPLSWILTASIILSIAVVPLTVGVFYIMDLSVIIFGLPNQYGAVFGLLTGILLSIAGGWIYSGYARKHVE